MKKRVTACFLVMVMVLTTIAPNGLSMTKKAKAAYTESGSLNDFTTDVVINPDVEVAEGVYTVRSDKTYEFTISFIETDDLQYTTKDSSYSDDYMQLQLPDGFVPMQDSGTADISGTTDHGVVTVPNNQFTIDSATNILTFYWNKTEDPEAYEDMRKNGRVKLSLTFKGSFDGEHTSLDFGNGVVVNVNYDDKKDLEVTKKAGDYNYQDGTVTYTLEVESTGRNTNIPISDVVDTAAKDIIKIDTSSIKAYKYDGSQYSSYDAGRDEAVNLNVSGDESGFTGTIPSMEDGEKVTIVYTANIDSSNMSETSLWGQATYGTADETKNTFSLNYESKPEGWTDTDYDNAKDHFSTTETFESKIYPKALQKAGSTEEVDDEGYADITWTLTVPSYYGALDVAGNTLTDTFSKTGLEEISYIENSLSVTKKLYTHHYNSDGSDSGWNDSATSDVTTAFSQNFSANSDGFTLKVPESEAINQGECAEYVITYKTRVKVSDVTENITVNNTAQLPGTTGGSGVGYVQGKEGAKPTVSKTADDSDYEKTTWTVTINVPSTGYSAGDDAVTFEDILPNMTGEATGNKVENEWGNLVDEYEQFQDTLEGDVTVTYSDKAEGEAYTVDTSNPKKIKVNFTQTVEGNSVPGFAATGADRTITITYTTKNDPDWLSRAENYSGWKDYKSHTNNANLYKGNESLSSSTATAKPVNREVSISKEAVYNNSTGDYTNKTANGYYNSNWQFIAYDTDVPVYKYIVTLKGIDDSSFDDNDQLVITDTFDSRLTMYEENGYEPICMGSAEGYNLSWGGDANAKVSSFTQDGNELKMVINKSDIVKSGSDYYTYYALSYYLRVKDQNALTSINQESLQASDGKAYLSNTASTDIAGSSKFDIPVTYQPFDKTIVDGSNKLSVTGDRSIQFKVVFNPDKMDLNPNGSTVTFKDTYSNLSFVYSSVKATLEGTDGMSYEDAASPNNEVHFDASGDSVTFTVPDNKMVTIVYTMRGAGTTGTNVRIQNLIHFGAVTDGIDQYENIASGGGDFEEVSVNVLKYADGDLTQPIEGVQFDLYDMSDDSTPLKRFKTDATGTAKIVGVYAEDGFYLKKGKTYYLQEVYDPEIHENYAYDDTKYQFTVNEDDIADYKNYIYHNYDILKISNVSTLLNIPVTKVWDAGGAESDVESVTFGIYANGKAVQKDNKDYTITVTPNEYMEWEGEFTDLTRKDKDGNLIEYTIKELSVNYKAGAEEQAYETVIERVDDTNLKRLDRGYLVTNKLTDTGSLTIKKTVTSKKDVSSKVYTVTVNADKDLSEALIDGKAISASTKATLSSDGKTITLSITKDEEITITNIPFTTYTVTETDKSEALDVDYSITAKGTGDSTTASSDSGNGEAVVVLSKSASGKTVNVTNNFNKADAKLILTKTVTGDLGYDDVKEKVSFDVTNLDTNETENYLLSDFTLQDGKYVKEITTDPDAEYSVTEKGYTVTGYKCTAKYNIVSSSTVEDATKNSATVTYGDNSTETVEFTNKYEMKLGYITLGKSFEGDVDKDLREANVKFTIIREDTNGTKTETVVGLNQFTYFSSTNNYGYAVENVKPTETVTIKESGYTIPGYNLSSVEYSVDNGAWKDGKDQAIEFTIPDGGGRSIDFNDTYSKDSGTIKLTKTIDGEANYELAKDNVEFTITKTDASGTSTVEKVKLSDTEKFKKDSDNKYVYTIENVKLTDTYKIGETRYNIDNYTLDGATFSVSNDNTQVDVNATVNVATVKVNEGEEVVNVDFTNTYSENRGEVKIVKTLAGLDDADVEKALKNVKFSVAIEHVNGTSDDKVIELSEFTLTDGKYVYTIDNLLSSDVVKVQETANSVNGYECTSKYSVKNDISQADKDALTNTATFYVSKGNGEIDYTNTYTAKAGKLVITKTIGGLVTPEEEAGGLVFTVTNTSNNKSEDFTLSQFTKDGDKYVLTLDELSGEAIDGNVTYSVQETNYTIKGYDVVTAKYDVTDGDGSTSTKNVTAGAVSVTAGKGGTATVDITDEYEEKLGKVVITKTLEGPVSENEAKGALVFTITKTDASGNVTTETKTLTDFTKNDDGTYTYEIKNVKTTDTISVQETTYDVPGYLSQSVTYSVQGDNTQKDKDGKSGAAVVTDIDGKTVNIDFKDVYIKDEGNINFTKAGDYTEDFNNAINLIPVAGVKFTAYKVSDPEKAVATAVSNANGNVVFESLPTGEYIIQETEVPEDLVLDNTKYYATVTKDSFEGLKKADGSLVTDNKLVNEVKKGVIDLLKVNESDTGQVLPASTYGLFRNEDPTDDKMDNLVKVAEATTDENGKISFDGVITGVSYVVKELVAPDGYYVSENPIAVKVTVKDDGSTKLTLLDSGDSNGYNTAVLSDDGTITWLEPVVVVAFNKVDEDDKFVAGAKLHVEDNSGNTIAQWESESKAYEITAGFNSGETYKLVEDEAPEGYEVAEAVTFTIDSTMGPGENKTITVTMTDKKKDVTETESPEPSESASATPSETPSATPSETPSATPSETPTATTTETPAVSETPTATATTTASETPETSSTPKASKKPKKTDTDDEDDSDDSDDGDDEDTNTGSGGDSDTPDTGDNRPFAPLIFLIVTSSVGIVTIIGVKRRRKRQYK